MRPSLLLLISTKRATLKVKTTVTTEVGTVIETSKTLAVCAARLGEVMRINQALAYSRLIALRKAVISAGDFT